MSTTLVRILKYGFQLFYRHGWLTISTITVMVIALIMYQALILFGVVTDTATVSLRDKIDIAVYFKTTAVENDILNIEKSLKGLPEVKTVEYVSRDQALATFKETHKDDPNINQALAELDSNPLRASLNIKANDTNNYPIIVAYLENEGFQTVVEKVTYAQNKIAIDRLNKLVDTMRKIGLSITIFLAFAASLVAFNTIRLAIYSNREEIGVMRLVGAANSFIKGPYIFSGILYGAVGALVTILLMIPAVNFASPYFQAFIPEMNLANYFFSNIISLFLYLFLFGTGLGIVSSWVAIRRYLKV
ncbi:MAG: permease-like cell division protein FtsX [bacterium]|nr:permease-like cell division protein FtsX [bacterium]